MVSTLLLVILTAGSDLHIYRGHQPGPYGYVIGHEAVGEIVEIGEGVKSFKLGERVISPFSTSCGMFGTQKQLTPGDCYYCEQGYTSRCIGGGGLLGCAANPGAQSEYVLIPEAESCLSHAPTDIKEELLLLMADILPTGYMVAYNARHMLDDGQVQSDFKKATVTQPKGKRGVAVVIGCGPVSSSDQLG